MPDRGSTALLVIDVQEDLLAMAHYGAAERAA
jgi:nicotinamidase-related amidase